MASSNVFGTPITDGTRLERASKALNDQNADGKRDDALRYVKQQKANWGTGVSTLAIFYNATGETLVYAKDDSSYGKIYGTYPTRVQNGQWGAFLHGKTTGAASGSVGLVMYRGKKDDTEYANQLIAWSTPWNQRRYNNEAYCDIFEDGKVDTHNDVYQKMHAIDSRQYVVIKNGIMLASKIEEGTSPLYEAEFTLADAVYAIKTAPRI